ncbi:hypothetical protein MUP59_05045 [Candidatus Bathyarchaeota archaeon]|nr:hypothetical protein [Candidatus Bathyarchaeota archaeon]
MNWKRACIEILSWLPFSSPKVALYRKLGATMGNRVRIGRGSFIWSSNFGGVTVGDGVTIRDSTRFFCERLTIEEDSYVERDSFVSGSTFFLGFGSYFGQRMFVDCTAPVTIGREVIISYTNIYTHEMNYAWVTEGRERRRSGPVAVGRRSSLAPGIHIGAGVTIGEHVIVGSGSIVLKNLAPYTLNVGVPCKEVRSIKEKFKAEVDLLDDIKKDLDNYFRQECRKNKMRILFGETLGKPELESRSIKNFFLIGNFVADEVFQILRSQSEQLISSFDLNRQLYHKNESKLTHEIKHRMRRFGLVFKPYDMPKGEDSNQLAVRQAI